MLVSKLSSILLTAAGLAAAQTSDDISAAIGKINQARQTRGLQPLAWNGDLAAYAAFWANQMATGAVPFGHASGPYRPDQGETLFERQSTQCDLAYDTPLLTAANAWLAEGSNWNGQPISSGHESWLHWCMYSFFSEYSISSLYP